MYNITESIENAIKDCIETGSGDVDIDDTLTVQTEWEYWDESSDFDVVTVYILEDGVIKLRYQEDETKVRS